MEVYIGNLPLHSKLKISSSMNAKVPSNYRLIREDLKIELSGEITNFGDFYLFDGEAKSVLEFECDKCLAPVTYLVAFPVIERFGNFKSEDEDIWEFQGKNIDLSEAVMMNLFLNIPIKYICSEDCRGLCPVCGQNLNKGKCGCESSLKNNHFEGLKSLFNDEEV